MSDRVVQSVNETNTRSRKSVQPYQSVWMAHWMRKSCAAAEETCIHNASGNKELDYAGRDDNLKNGLQVSRHVKGLGLIETKTCEIVNESFKISLKGMENGRMRSSLFGLHLKCGKSVNPTLIPRTSALNEISPQGYYSLGVGSSKNPPKWMKTISAGKDSSSTMPNPLQENFVDSSRHIVPYRFDLEKYEFDKRKSSVSPFTGQSAIVSKQLLNVNLRMLEHEHCYEQNQSADDLVCDRKMDCHSRLDNSMNVCFRENATCDHYLSTYGQDCIQMIQKPSENENMHHLGFCKRNTQSSPRFSQTTHGLLITKKTYFNLSKENDIFSSTGVITRINGNISSDLHSLSPIIVQGESGVKLNPLSISIDREANKNAGHVKASKITIKGESLTETDTMDMDSFFKEKNLHSCGYSTAPAEAPNVELKLKRPSIALPDINLELPASPGAASLSENSGPSFSKTQSMEIDKLLVPVEQPKPKPNSILVDHPDADPCNRWVKRLKLSSSSSFAQGPKTPNFAENPSHEKISKSFSRMLKNRIINSEPSPRKHHGKAPTLSDKSGDFLKKNEDLMVDPKTSGAELLLSNAWIERWLSNKSRNMEKKPQTVVVCEPESSKLAMEKLQKEQLPSIAAMALMGRAITGFQQCELQKRGSFTVWNTTAS